VSCGSRAFSFWNRSILTEIYLCRACSYHEIERAGELWLAVPFAALPAALVLAQFTFVVMSEGADECDEAQKPPLQLFGRTVPYPSLLANALIAALGMLCHGISKYGYLCRCCCCREKRGHPVRATTVDDAHEALLTGR
jgi:hypothetical protein